MSKESGFLRWNLLLGKVVEMTTRDLEYYINFAGEAVAGLEKNDSIFEKSSPTGKMQHGVPQTCCS